MSTLSRTPCSILLPLAYNDGTPVAEDEMESIKDQIFVEFGAYTVEGVKEGAYRREDTGEKQVEHMLEIKVAVPGQEGVQQLRELLAGLAKRLDQESMYLEIRTGATVELVGQKQKGGGR
jgi:hypothetical protein